MKKENKMLDYGPDGNKYRYTGPYPDKSSFKVYHIYKGGKCLCSFGYGLTEEVPYAFMYDDEKIILRNPSGFAPSARNILTLDDVVRLKKLKFIVEEEVHPDFEKAYKAIKDKSAALTEQWYKDIYKEYGLSPESPLTQKILGKAYEDGHSAGYQEVEGKLLDLLEFAEDVIKLVQKGHFLYE
jgi:hypothetical protein